MKGICKSNLAIVAASGITLVLVFAACLYIFRDWYENWKNEKIILYQGDCNVAVIPIIGDIIVDTTAGYYDLTTGADLILEEIDQAERNKKIKGVLFTIESSGGSLVGGEMIMNAIKQLSKPSIVVVQDAADSSAYMLATGAQHIIASNFSEVGSIGVTESYLANVSQDNKVGTTFEQLSSGPYKDMMNPDKPLTDSERALVYRDLKIYHNWFVALVASNRNLPIDQVQKLADGSTLPGELALKAGLIDELGDQNTAKVWLEKKIGKKVEWCK